MYNFIIKPKEVKVILSMVFILCIFASCGQNENSKVLKACFTPVPTPTPIATSTQLHKDKGSNGDDINDLSEPKPLTHPKYASEDIIDLVKDYISKEKEDEIFKLFSVGKKLESSSLSKIQISSEGKEYLQKILKENDYAENTATLVDIDNDNDNDDEIVTHEYLGGTAGFVYLAVLKKNKSGIYEFSEYPNYENIFGIVWSRYGYIRYKNKIYYIDKQWNYSTHVFEGVNIYAFENGKVVEHIFVSKYSDKYKLTTEYTSGDYYSTLENNISINADKVLSSLKSGKVYYGAMEKKASEQYVKRIEKDIITHWDIEWQEVDMDNDNTPEFIGKGIDLPSSMSHERSLYYIISKNKIDKFDEIDLQQEYGIMLTNEKYSIQQLWFEEYLGKVYIIALAQDNNENIYHFKAFLISKSSTSKVIDIKAEYLKEASTEIWTEGINIKFEHASQYEPGG